MKNGPSSTVVIVMSLKGFDIEVIFGYLNPHNEVHACNIKSQKAPGRSHYFLIPVKADLIFNFSPVQCRRSQQTRACL